MLNCLKFGEAIPRLQHKSANTLVCIKEQLMTPIPASFPLVWACRALPELRCNAQESRLLTVKINVILDL